MNNFIKLKQILTILFLSLTINSFSQINNVSMENIEYLGNSISECGTINFSSSNSHVISFDVNVEVESTPNGFIYTEGNLKIAYWTGSAQEVYHTYVVDASDWTYNTQNTNAYLNLPTINMQLFNNDFDAGDTEGGKIYLIYTETTNNNIDDSCDINITKPRFTLTPNSTTITCGSSSSKTFTVNNENNSPGVQQYQWSVGNGWLYNGSSISNFTTPNNSIQLTPTSFPPDNVSVTPKLDGNSFPELTSTISLGEYTPNNVITGGEAVCSSENFNVFGLANGTSVTNWSINNTNIASITSNGNQVTVTPTGNGVINITATLTNSCGQTFDIFKNNVAIGSPAITSYGINGGYNNAAVNSTIQYNVDGEAGVTGYEWSVTPNTTCSLGASPTINGSNSNVYVSASRYALINMGACTGTYSVVCRAINDCGSSYIGQKMVTVYDPYNGGGNPCDDNWRLASYPNPIKGDGSVVVNKYPPGNPCDDLPVTDLKQSQEKSDVKIYDFFGNVVYKNQFKGNNFNIKETNLKPGSYILNVSSLNGQNLKKIIVVE